MDEAPFTQLEFTAIPCISIAGLSTFGRLKSHEKFMTGKRRGSVYIPEIDPGWSVYDRYTQKKIQTNPGWLGFVGGNTTKKHPNGPMNRSRHGLCGTLSSNGVVTWLVTHPHPEVCGQLFRRNSLVLSWCHLVGLRSKIYIQGPNPTEIWAEASPFQSWKARAVTGECQVGAKVELLESGGFHFYSKPQKTHV